MRRIPDASADSLQAFVEETIEPGSLVHTDGWHGYDRLKATGYRHRVKRQRTTQRPGSHSSLPSGGSHPRRRNPRVRQR